MLKIDGFVRGDLNQKNWRAKVLGFMIIRNLNKCCLENFFLHIDDHHLIFLRVNEVDELVIL